MRQNCIFSKGKIFAVKFPTCCMHTFYWKNFKKYEKFQWGANLNYADQLLLSILHIQMAMDANFIMSHLHLNSFLPKILLPLTCHSWGCPTRNLVSVSFFFHKIRPVRRAMTKKCWYWNQKLIYSLLSRAHLGLPVVYYKAIVSSGSSSKKLRRSHVLFSGSN